MKFGIFDHLDRGAGSLGEQYEARLRLIEAYDAAGYHAYHIAEHHMTPLGMSPSPNVFLSAAAQRSRRLRFGPLVYCLSLYHPLRVLEEICMLDQLSGGRFELGIGRGVQRRSSWAITASRTGQRAVAVRGEALAVTPKGAPDTDSLNFEGRHFQFRDVPGSSCIRCSAAVRRGRSRARSVPPTIGRACQISSGPLSG